MTNIAVMTTRMVHMCEKLLGDRGAFANIARDISGGRRGRRRRQGAIVDVLVITVDVVVGIVVVVVVTGSVESRDVVTAVVARTIVAIIATTTTIVVVVVVIARNGVVGSGTTATKRLGEHADKTSRRRSIVIATTRVGIGSTISSMCIATAGRDEVAQIVHGTHGFQAGGQRIRQRRALGFQAGHCRRVSIAGTVGTIVGRRFEEIRVGIAGGNTRYHFCKTKQLMLMDKTRSDIGLQQIT